MSNVEFKFKRIRERDSAGKLTKAGGSWREYTAVNYAYREEIWLLMLLSIALIAGGLWFQASFRFDRWVGSLAIVLGIFPGIASVARHLWPAPVRALSFTADGKIMEKIGVQPWRVWSKTPVKEIESIGTASSVARDIKWVQCIKVITVYGDSYIVADHLHPDDARKVTVELNLALKEIRAAVDVPVAASDGPWGKAAPRLID